MAEKRLSDSTIIGQKYMDSLLVEMRHIGAKAPSTELKLFGESFSSPVMPAALSHMHRVRENGMIEIAKGTKAAGTLMWTGMGDEAELESIVATGVKTVKIIKPYVDNDRIIAKIKHAGDCGAFAVGMDLDHAFDRNGRFDTIEGEKMSSKSFEEFRSFVNAAKVPFILKGVMSVRDAIICKELGVKGIVVSHHHGLLEYAVPALMILPEIRKAVGPDMKIFVDGGIETGMDAFKALALGADAVNIGRPIIAPLKEKGAEGVKETLIGINDGLRHAMGLTASENLAAIDSSLIHKTGFTLN